MFVRVGLPEPLLNHPIHASWDPNVLLGYGDLVWHMVLPCGRVIKVIGEYQGQEFHSSDEQRAHDKARRHRLARDGWTIIEIWKADLETAEARHAIVLRFAKALDIDVDTLALTQAEPRFFSRHAMDLAEQRAAQHHARY